MKAIFQKLLRRKRRKRRVRKGMVGTPERPRLSVFRSHSNIYAQIVDDTQGLTLVSASSMEKELRQQLQGKRGNKAAAEAVGARLAAKAVQTGIQKIVFDRGGYRYHGRVRALAEAARKAGLSF